MANNKRLFKEKDVQRFEMHELTDKNCFALVTKCLGDCRFECNMILPNGKLEVIHAKLIGKLKNNNKKHKSKIVINSFVILDIDDNTTNDSKYFIMHKCNTQEEKAIRKLMKVADSNEIVFDESNQQEIIDDDFINNL